MGFRAAAYGNTKATLGPRRKAQHCDALLATVCCAGFLGTQVVPCDAWASKRVHSGSWLTSGAPPSC